MADQQHGVRIARDVVLQPQRAFEVEVVGRLVEQQQVGLRKQHRGQRHAHAPAAGERRGRPLLRVGVEAEAGKDGGGARLGRMRVDVGKPHVDLGDAVRIGRRLLFGHQRQPLGVGLEHDLDQRLLGARRFLRDLADAHVLGQADRAGLDGISPVMALNSVVLPVPLRPTSPAFEPVGKVTEAWSSRRRPAMRSERSLMMSMAGAYWPTGARKARGVEGEARNLRCSDARG